MAECMALPNSERARKGRGIDANANANAETLYANANAGTLYACRMRRPLTTGALASTCVLLAVACHREPAPRSAGASRSPPSPTSFAPIAHDAGALRAAPSPCDRIDARQRAAPAIGGDTLTRSVFRRCSFAERGGAVGLVPTPVTPPAAVEHDNPLAFHVVYEAANGTSLVSGELAASVASPPEDALVFPARAPGGPPVVFVKFATHLVPAHFDDPAPVQSAAFFSALSRDPPGRPHAFVWTGLRDGDSRGGYGLSFRLPPLTWKEGRPYGGERSASLRGVEAFVLLTPRYELAPTHDLRRAVSAACEEITAPDGATPSQLWESAQCQHIRGVPDVAVLEAVARRCVALARQALPHARALAAWDRHERDERDDKRPAQGEREALVAAAKRVNPPSACFAADMLWDVDYTARTRAFKVPAVSLDPAWSAGLAALAEWPR